MVKVNGTYTYGKYKSLVKPIHMVNTNEFS